jgi:hypothetical protein
MIKTHKIICIPIQKKIETEDIIMNGSRGYYLWKKEFKNPIGKACQLLLLSDDEIKKGDYCISNNKNSKIYNYTFKCEEGAFTNSEWLNSEDCKDICKVIASYPQLDNLPTFSKEFIQEWINNTVEEVLCEYYGDEEVRYEILKTNNTEIICNIPKVQLVESPCDFSNDPAILEEKVKEITYTESEVLEIIDDLFHCYASLYRHEAKEHFLESYKKK